MRHHMDSFVFAELNQINLGQIARCIKLYESAPANTDCSDDPGKTYGCISTWLTAGEILAVVSSLLSFKILKLETPDSISN